ncbi:Cof-type HAD-IIB family hydrolase [Halanaerocella petrolearia]
MKLIALDLDGTTLNSEKEISEENIRVIKEAQKEGHIVMVLSGRSRKSISEKLTKYGLDCPIGATNGTAVFVDGELIELTSLTQSQNREIITKLDEEFMPYNVTTNKGVIAPSDWNERFERVISSGRVPEEYYKNEHYEMFTNSPIEAGQTLFDNIEEVLNNEELMLQKYFVLGLDPDQNEKVESYLASVKETKIVKPSSFSFDVSHINGHKGNGLKVMARHFNIPLENTVAIGDEGNDIPMLEVAGLSIAMESGNEEVKKQSDVITLSNDEHGVAYAIKKYVLKERIAM